MKIFNQTKEDGMITTQSSLTLNKTNRKKIVNRMMMICKERSLLVIKAMKANLKLLINKTYQNQNQLKNKNKNPLIIKHTN